MYHSVQTMNMYAACVFWYSVALCSLTACEPGAVPFHHGHGDHHDGDYQFVVVAENGVLRLLGKATTVTKMPGLKLPVVQPLATSPVYVTLGVYRGLHFRFNSVGAPGKVLPPTF